MRKTIAVAVAASFLALGTAPAFAIIPFLIPVLMSKEDKNFKPVNPYAKPAKTHHHHAKKRH
jgi:hypothetical protein